MTILALLTFAFFHIPTYCSNKINQPNLTTEPVTSVAPVTHVTPVGNASSENLQEFLLSFKSEYEREIILQQLNYCPFINMCRFSLGRDQPVFPYASCCQNCTCQFPSCLENKSCCPDVLFDNTNTANETYTVPQIQKQCIFMYLSKSVRLSRGGTFGYASCPHNTNEGLLDNCTRRYEAGGLTPLRLTDTVPVSGVTSLDIYRNRYCAYCNGVLDDQFDTLQANLTCTDTMRIETDKDIMSAILADGQCDVQFYGFDNCITAIAECNVTGLWGEYDASTESACSMYISVIRIDRHMHGLQSYVKSMYFQNVFCGICNGMLPGAVSCKLSSDNEIVDPFSFSGLLKLDKRDVHVEDSFPANGECSENQLYDTILRTCKDLVCPVIMSMHNGRCTERFEQLKDIIYTTFLRIVPMESISIYDSSMLADHVIDHMTGYMRNLTGNELCGIQMLYTSSMVLNSSDLDPIKYSNLLYFDVRIQYYANENHDPKAVVAKLMSFHGLEHAFGDNHSNKTVKFKYDVRNGKPGQFDTVSNISQSRDINDGLVHVPSDTYSIPLLMFILNYATARNDGLAIFPHLIGNDDRGFCNEDKIELDIVCLTPCSKVNISKIDLPWKETDEGVTIQTGNFTFKSNEYYHADENHIVVCSEKYQVFLRQVTSLHLHSLSIETIVSIVCSSFSILSLGLTLAMFCILPQLRQTIPGKNNISLVSFLLCAQSLYLISNFSGLEKHSTECMILGISVHIFWLLAVFWMNICTFHMFRVLTQSKVISRESGMKQVVIYHIYALTLSAIFVCINMTTSHYVFGDIGYGGDVCYISSQRMVIYAFGLPTFVVVLSNILMFTFVIIKIKRSPSVQKNVQHERNDLIVFAKLSTITGATWIFGFLYVWTDVTAMSYLFIILNAGQGVFILFAFAINRRAYDLFRFRVVRWIVSFDSGPPTVKPVVHTTAL